MKLNVSLNDELISRLDEYAERNYMSRSGLISLAVTQFLNSNEMILAINDISVAMRKIAETGTLDDELISELEDFERISRLFSQTK